METLGNLWSRYQEILRRCAEQVCVSTQIDLGDQKGRTIDWTTFFKAIRSKLRQRHFPLVRFSRWLRRLGHRSCTYTYTAARLSAAEAQKDSTGVSLKCEGRVSIVKGALEGMLSSNGVPETGDTRFFEQWRIPAIGSELDWTTTLVFTCQYNRTWSDM